MSEPYVHPLALCESSKVGQNTRVWAFAHVLPAATIGADCNICDGVFIENDVVVGDRVTIKCGVQLWDGLRVEDDVFIGPNATFVNDRIPRSKVRPAAFEQTIIRRGASIGANATVLSGLEIGARAMVGAAAVVTRSVPPRAVVVGNPAHIIGYVDDEPAHQPGEQPLRADLSTPARVRGVALHKLPFIKDMRGDLIVGEFGRTLPFTPKRFFLVFDVPSKEVRGEHAHRTCHQLLICVRGSCVATADDGTNRQQFILDRSDVGLYVPPMVWGTQHMYTPDALLLVLASDYYDPDDYIRSYDEFKTAVRSA